MTRFLLTLLALVTGLVVQTAPAQARVCIASGAEIGALESPAGAVRVVVQGQQANGPRASCEVPGVARGCRRAPQLTIYLPAVQFGADRALE